MQLFALLKTFIYLISSCLLYPTIMLLSTICLWLILYTGGFLAELLERSKLKRFKVDEIKKGLQNGAIKEILPHKVVLFTEKIKTVKKIDPNCEIELEYLLQTESFKLMKDLDFIKLLIRLGPALGLIGTLIPMGTGLAGLGQGDMTKLTSDLVIAFTTTVVGLAEGMLAYCFYMIRKRWAEEDIRNIEYITEIIANEIPEEKKISS